MTLPVNLGTANLVAIVAQVNAGTLAQTAKVLLSQSYQRNPPPDYPVCNAGSAGNPLAMSSFTFAAGATLTLFSDEAAALVAAGAATYT